MTEPTTVQENFLTALLDEGATVNVYLINGIKLIGKISSFDHQTISLDCESRNAGSKTTIQKNDDEKKQMVFKHAIATIMPV